ncbi:hypothetical protein GNP95_15640 [Paenibacillus woosongensis]|uniref:Copper amine oxidase-like N-terminal domain-containing protein n=2 Tax=Paenibacillus woosongensis TaxID=307580 RepID=A0A7X2Z407_9BACL|nr:hypothetical protein [Paenibacillus woosongensis]
MQQYDQPPILQNGRTLVPLRGIFETLGATVHWNQTEETVTAFKGDRTIQLTIGSKQAKINEQLHNLDVAAKTVNNRTMVPLRFIGEALGEDVLWEQATRTVYIGNRVEPTTESANKWIEKVRDIYEDLGTQISADDYSFTAAGNGISQAFINQGNGNHKLFIHDTGDSNNFTVAAQVAIKLGGSGDASKIAAAIDTAFKGESGGPVKLGNVTVSPAGRGVILSW